MNDAHPQFSANRETAAIQTQATVFFVVTIAAVGAMMMTLTSSPTAKGASFLWLPAALQLIAGIWLGPWRGSIAGGLGAYLAGILAYGGWGLVDIIMNPIAGGIGNTMLPALLFSALGVDPSLGTDKSADPVDLLYAAGRVGALAALALIVTFAVMPLQLGLWSYAPLFLLLSLAPLFLGGLKISKRQFLTAFLICIFSSAVSAVFGVAGQVVGGQTWQAATLGTGLGWFLGDTVSSVLGLYLLASFTERARMLGIAR
jgi:hypothetical protein